MSGEGNESKGCFAMCCSCLKLKFVGKAWSSILSCIKFSQWKLGSQIITGVTCSLCCVIMILTCIFMVSSNPSILPALVLSDRD